MRLVAFLHTPCHVPQTGRVHRVHYRSSLGSVRPGKVHHHSLLPHPDLPRRAIPIPAPPAATGWTLPATDWMRFYRKHTIPLLLPGQTLRVAARSTANRGPRPAPGPAQ